MENLKVEYIDINNIKPYEKNARMHSEEQIDMISNSIKEFGMNDPIGIWGKENIIIEGHGRLLALKKLGFEKAPCIRLDYLTEEQRKAYTLAHNKVSEFAEWDFTKLEEELSNIELDMQQFGFEEIEKIDVEQFFEDDDADNEAEPKEEEKEEIQCPHCNMWFIKE